MTPPPSDDADKLADAVLQRFAGSSDPNNIERPSQEVETKRAQGGRVIATNIEHNPSEAQIKAGNYKKEHVSILGLDITVENARGQERSGTGKDGKRWSVKMPAHYGYFKRTEGKDGDHVDVYLGPHIKSKLVFVVNQVDADTRKFDEHKVLLGFGNLQQALNTYEKGFSDGKGSQRVGSIVQTNVDQLKAWLKDGDTTKPFNIKTN